MAMDDFHSKMRAVLANHGVTPDMIARMRQHIDAGRAHDLPSAAALVRKEDSEHGSFADKVRSTLQSSGVTAAHLAHAKELIAAGKAHDIGDAAQAKHALPDGGHAAITGKGPALQTGARGGKYYVGQDGKKVYVK